jgi:hypothetical protein
LLDPGSHTVSGGSWTGGGTLPPEPGIPPGPGAPPAPIPVTDITLNYYALNEEVCYYDYITPPYRLTATVVPDNATDQTVTWSSSDPTIAFVDPDDGTVVGHKMGKVNITATAAGGTGVTKTCEVTVWKAYVITSTGAGSDEHTFADAVTEIDNTPGAPGYYSLRINGGVSGVTAAGTSMTVKANTTVFVRQDAIPAAPIPGNPGTLKSGGFTVNSGGTLILRDAGL